VKVLLYSHYFHPSVGGVETVSLALANGFNDNGIECIVVTTSPGNEEDRFSFEVVRNPKMKEQLRLVKWADIILYNGVSLALQPWILLYRKPFIWVHVGYQVSCIDGLGWVEGKRAPITPFASLRYHARLNGWTGALKAGSRLFLKRSIAKYFVTKNIAITKWLANMQPLPRQLQIYNPFPIGHFLQRNDMTEVYDFIYVGRIVSEKGLPTLLYAFSQVLAVSGQSLQLLVVGDGNWRAKMENLAAELNIAHLVNFVGKKTGEELGRLVSTGRIAIIPSEWYEPMGGVALELMAAGKNLIVSEKGGLKECVGEGAVTFNNGDSSSLASCMIELHKNTLQQQHQRALFRERVKEFEPAKFIAQYIDLLNKTVGAK
jgi:glycosyltransferase involved in cell wall biosynthesis